MRIRGAWGAAAALALTAAAGAAEAQTRHRWSLEYEQEKPRIYTYRDPMGRLENYWYFTYTVRNGGPEVVPLILDHMMYVATGKDLLNIRISTLARTDRPDRGYLSPALADLENRDYNESPYPADDVEVMERSARRRTFTTVVDLRNFA